MNRIYLYTIWQRIPDLIENPLIPDDLFLEFGQETFVMGEGESKQTHPVMILDPGNPRGVRYVAIKCIDDINIAQEICSNPNGEYCYTYQEAWMGES